MSDPMLSRSIPETVLERQAEASDPTVSAWVSANAGSGKTHVLAQRVIRLLLGGVDPAKILCITFTKAAAANMANRVFDELRRWIALDDTELDTAIRKAAGFAPDAAQRTHARRLFAIALETPGGLKVQTIHAFCTRLLHQFPFEANVAARFQVLDEAAQTQLLNEVSLGVLLDAAKFRESSLGRALAIAITVVADRTFKEVVGEAIRKRDLLRAWIDHDGNMESALARLCTSLDIAGDDTPEQVESEITEGPFLPSCEWDAAAKVFETGTNNDQSQAARLRTAWSAVGSERVESYLEVFFTKSGRRDSLMTRALARKHQGLDLRLDQEQQRLFPLEERRKALACRDRTAALVAIADAVISRYRAAKDRRGLLDYDDLIDRTLMLLSEERAAWVHYKLDQGIDHVLIDEAQDTSPKQWEIVRRLTGEFFAGAGARDVVRTVFAVGDEKQSIFSFQGAAPREFDAMRRMFATLCRGIGHDLRYVPLRRSFRSGPNLLAAVDKVFGRPEAFTGLSADNAPTVHEALPDAAPGSVEIWDTLKPEEKREIEAWDAPFDEQVESSASMRLAAKIARKVKRWIDEGTSAGEVLVLVRQRGPLFEAIIRALKDQQIPVAGADRLVLTEHIAVMDLMVLADALLLPDDDLALATVLRSPLFGFEEDHLFEIAWQRKGSLRRALRYKATAHLRFATAAARLDRLEHWARRDTPFAFYARVLGAEGGRRQFLARLGHEADDALDELLNLALEYERRETPSLQGFVAWLRTTQTDVKRDMEISRDEVRVMTVHGAKGLEAPIVILADTTTPPAGPVQHQPRLVAMPAADAQPGTPDALAWVRARSTDVPATAAARERVRREAENEHRRLLYVAMTRARDRLVVCGAEGALKRQPGCWWDLVFHALRADSVEGTDDDDAGKVWSYRPASAGVGRSEPAGAATEPPADLPSWLDRDAHAEPARAPPLSPSRAYDAASTARAIGAGDQIDRAKVMARGVLMHRLLQSLPDLASAARLEAGRRHLARNAAVLSAVEREAMLGEVLAVLEDLRFAGLFQPGSRAEVPIVGRLEYQGRNITVSGLVDRLAVLPDAVLIADYKTNRPAPASIDNVPEAYITQLALYRAVLSQLYPDRSVRAALLFTEVPELMEIPAAALDRALTLPVTSA